MPVVLYGCETWSHSLREERRLRVYDKRVLRRTFEAKRDEVTVEWRKLHNEELNDMYSSPSTVWVITSRRMRWAGHAARAVEKRVVYSVLVGKLERKRPPGRLGVDVRIILSWIFRKWDVGLWTGSSWFRIVTRGLHL